GVNPVVQVDYQRLQVHTEVPGILVVGVVHHLNKNLLAAVIVDYSTRKSQEWGEIDLINVFGEIALRFHQVLAHMELRGRNAGMENFELSLQGIQIEPMPLPDRCQLLEDRIILWR